MKLRSCFSRCRLCCSCSSSEMKRFMRLVRASRAVSPSRRLVLASALTARRRTPGARLAPRSRPRPVAAPMDMRAASRLRGPSVLHSNAGWRGGDANAECGDCRIGDLAESGDGSSTRGEGLSLPAVVRTREGLAARPRPRALRGSRPAMERLRESGIGGGKPRLEVGGVPIRCWRCFSRSNFSKRISSSFSSSRSAFSVRACSMSINFSCCCFMEDSRAWLRSRLSCSSCS
mmetsp:Transcript_53801/g.95880  ORF Transcript_53801/g.95880 Transcript_53801/m.95880 type:complete len:232 (-) Transcript_53801:2666-3361(-)